MLTARFHRHVRRGATLVMIAIVMAILLGMVAFAYEIGRVYVVRSQVQQAVDAGALAAGLRLKRNPGAVDDAVAVARQFAQLNRVGWLVAIPEDLIAVETGTWNDDSRTLTPTTDAPSAVRVSGRQENKPFFFARVLGQSTFSAPASAIATGGSRPLDVVMMLDLSESMGSEGRIEALRSAAPSFVNVIEGIGGDDWIGVMAYGAKFTNFPEGTNGTPYMHAPVEHFPPNSDWVAVVEADAAADFDDLRNNILTTGNLVPAKYASYTPIGAAIRDASHYLTNHATLRDDAKKAIVLMSDGRANRPEDDGPGHALDMADYAASWTSKCSRSAWGTTPTWT